jgi:hypothetical protein
MLGYTFDVTVGVFMHLMLTGRVVYMHSVTGGMTMDKDMGRMMLSCLLRDILGTLGTFTFSAYGGFAIHVGSPLLIHIKRHCRLLIPHYALTLATPCEPT